MYKLESHDGAAVFSSDGKRLRVGFVADGIVRVTFTEGREFLDKPSRIVSEAIGFVPFELRDEYETFCPPVLYTSPSHIQYQKHCEYLHSLYRIE